jgi:hypothetical protein
VTEKPWCRSRCQPVSVDVDDEARFIAWGEPSQITIAHSRWRVIRSALSGTMPVPVPIYGHRYVPTVPSTAGNPVLSCHQADIVYYGTDLLGFKREFGRRSCASSRSCAPRVSLTAEQ